MKNSHSEIKISPRTWEKNLKSNLKKEWYGYYYFYSTKYPLGKIKVASSTMEGIKYSLRLIKKATEKTGTSILEIGKVRKRDIRLILDTLLEMNYSNDRYNKVKANLGILYNYFVDLEIFEHNYIHFIKKLPHTPAIRKILRKDDKEKFEELKILNYELWRFCKMFYYSGCRISEFRNLKISDINFKKQEFVIFEKKGKRYHEVIKPININVVYLWKEILAKIQKDDEFLFSNGLTPGNTPITEAALSHRYRRWVVKKLGIKVDLYALRHTYLNDITTIYGISKAKDIAGHTNERTTRIYAVDYQENILNEQKKVYTGF